MGKVKEMVKEEKYLDELLKYQEAYHILMDYWDSFPDERKNHIHKRLEKLGL